MDLCETCFADVVYRIRRVRCDEAKPACNRCVSTGRKCDGYEAAPPAASSSDASTSALPDRTTTSSSSSRSPPESTSASSSDTAVAHRQQNGHFAVQATADAKLALPRTDPEELRGYRYFIEVTAPAIAGCFDMKFWLQDLPRVCLADPAIWHAVISLGSVHERYALSSGSSSLARNVFALRQFNASIRSLMESHSPRRADKMRALTVSAIFTCICVLDGQYTQARIHAGSGVQLLKEIDDEQREKRSLNTLKKLMMGPPRQPDLTRSDYGEDGAEVEKPSWQIPITPAAVRSIIHSYEVAEKTFASGGLDHLPPLMSDNERWGIWSTYKIPSTSATGQSPLTLTNISGASRAAESLVHGLSRWAHENGDGLATLCAAPTVEFMLQLLSTQAPYVKCLRVLQRAVRVFEREIAAGQGHAKGADEATMLVLERAMLALQCYLNLIKFVLIGDPDSDDVLARYRSLPVICGAIVDGAQRIIDIETRLKADGVSMPPVPGLATPLFTVAFAGFSWPVRRRALALLRVPRLDGLWDTLMAAALAQATIEREKEAVMEGRACGLPVTMRSAVPDDPEEETATMFRVYKIYADFTGKREMRLRLRTWGEVINGEYGRESMVYW